jgi:hypothetical protein
MRHSLGHQHPLDTMATIPLALELFDICAGKSLVVQVTEMQAPVDGPLDLIVGETSVSQLAGQFRTTVVSLRQNSQSSGKTVLDSGPGLHGTA